MSSEKDFPPNSHVQYKECPFGEGRTPVSVSYETAAGKIKTVPVTRTPDGDHRAKGTNWTPDGEPRFDDAKPTINGLDP